MRDSPGLFCLSGVLTSGKESLSRLPIGVLVFKPLYVSLECGSFSLVGHLKGRCSVVPWPRSPEVSGPVMAVTLPGHVTLDRSLVKLDLLNLPLSLIAHHKLEKWNAPC